MPTRPKHEAIAGAQILEACPYHRRGACCLLGGFTSDCPADWSSSKTKVEHQEAPIAQPLTKGPH
jgi:hypothetical protein